MPLDMAALVYGGPSYSQFGTMSLWLITDGIIVYGENIALK